jgi:hypothetical protein
VRCFLEHKGRSNARVAPTPVLGTARRGRGVRAGSSPRGATAFTLLETLVACGLLLSIALFICYSFSSGFALIRLNQENVRADQILVQKMETLRVYHWTNVVSGRSIPTNFTSSFFGAGASATGAAYTGALSITPAPLTESYKDSLRQVTVTLTWDTGNGPRTRSMTTFVSQHGLQTYKP